MEAILVAGTGLRLEEGGKVLKRMDKKSQVHRLEVLEVVYP